VRLHLGDRRHDRSSQEVRESRVWTGCQCEQRLLGVDGCSTGTVVCKAAGVVCKTVEVVCKTAESGSEKCHYCTNNLSDTNHEEE
jgi:hypothetical protein